ncbi:ABC transporter ATP-binding protein [Agrococcus jejuensis]|uniref:Energy-coupling factor transport system ATP-binding protein n=1 Tax=Agrococcus jejuensis TaxID=399736 RepID=A0A1G8GZR6_9MICO|nr:ATP-binding cassette domain-containing protein [Agrococcus jejuensis]SDH99834.1 energy-coupling factor transport system ATP-binding protein [Agrococcus jejuensis]
MPAPHQPPAPMPLVVDGVSIRHEGATVARPASVSFSVAPGEVVLLSGPSGCGKSTLALALDGLVPHAVPATMAGSVVVDGLDTREHAVGVLSAHVAMVFQDPDAQIVTGTVLDKVCFGPENLEVPVAEVLERAERALRRVGLWERRDDRPDLLSGGGRQRLAIACALAMETPLIVLDEPTANLDPAGIEGVYAALADVVAAGDRAIVLVEHDLDHAIALVDRMVVLDASGAVALEGTVDAVLRARHDELAALGVWMPVATLAARRLREAGLVLEPMPVTPAELAAALDAKPTLPALPASPSPAPGADDPVVQVRGLSVKRGRGRHARDVLHDVSLDVERGAFVAIVGTNGAGKSTLLQAIAGVDAPPRGTVTIAGLDPATADVRALARTIGFVFQNPEHQLIRESVAAELAHGLEVQGLDAAAIAPRVDAMLERFGLAELREQHPFLLSGGQKRRLSVGTSLIAGAEVLALDEPTFGQDRARAAELVALLAGMRAQGTTVLVVTHDMQLVADVATHVCVVADGRIAAFDRAEAVLAGDALVDAGLRRPPLADAMRALRHHDAWRGVARMHDLPGGAS